MWRKTVDWLCGGARVTSIEPEDAPESELHARVRRDGWAVAFVAALLLGGAFLALFALGACRAIFRGASPDVGLWGLAQTSGPPLLDALAVVVPIPLAFFIASSVGQRSMSVGDAAANWVEAARTHGTNSLGTVVCGAAGVITLAATINSARQGESLLVGLVGLLCGFLCAALCVYYSASELGELLIRERRQRSLQRARQWVAAMRACGRQEGSSRRWLGQVLIVTATVAVLAFVLVCASGVFARKSGETTVLLAAVVAVTTAVSTGFLIYSRVVARALGVTSPARSASWAQALPAWLVVGLCGLGTLAVLLLSAPVIGLAAVLSWLVACLLIATVGRSERADCEVLRLVVARVAATESWIATHEGAPGDGTNAVTI